MVPEPNKMKLGFPDRTWSCLKSLHCMISSSGWISAACCPLYLFDFVFVFLRHLRVRVRVLSNSISFVILPWRIITFFGLQFYCQGGPENSFTIPMRIGIYICELIRAHNSLEIIWWPKLMSLTSAEYSHQSGEQFVKTLAFSPGCYQFRFLDVVPQTQHLNTGLFFACYILKWET